jgi:hypothetical protein
MQKPHEFNSIMLWAACCLAFFVFLRAGEFTIQPGEQFDLAIHLTLGDVEVNELANPSMLKIRIKMSKIDQWREGVDLFVGKTGSELCPVANPLKIRIKKSKTDQWREGVDLFVGKTGSELCPVAAILAFLAARGQDNASLFKTKEGTPLTRQKLANCQGHTS